jgi:hypothetical protein
VIVVVVSVRAVATPLFTGLWSDGLIFDPHSLCQPSQSAITDAYLLCFWRCRGTKSSAAYLSSLFSIRQLVVDHRVFGTKSFKISKLEAVPRTVKLSVFL